jgi:5-methyltetrahydropteroyltriglutamate--homocysteine methyltransferase
MQRSTERILTTHAGRLPNPDNIAAIQQARADGDQATFDRLVKAGIADRVRKQIELRNDIHSDGEFWKARDEQYYNSRVTGVDMQPLQPGEGPSILVRQQERHMPEFREFYAIYDQLGNIPRPGVVNPQLTHKAVITGPVKYKGQDAIKHELAVVKAGIVEAGAQVEDFFFPVLGPGWAGWATSFSTPTIRRKRHMSMPWRRCSRVSTRLLSQRGSSCRLMILAWPISLACSTLPSR